MQDADLFNLLVQLLVLAAAGFVGCYLAERLGTARIVGGLVAGLLIGPSLLGKVAPDAERWLWKGAQTELAELASLEEEYKSAMKASIISGVSEIHQEILKEEYEPRIIEAQTDALRAQDDHRHLTFGFAVFAMALLLLTIGRDGPLLNVTGSLSRAVPLAVGSLVIPVVGAVAAAWLLGPPNPGEVVSPGWIFAISAGLAVCAAPLSQRLLGKCESELSSIVCAGALVNIAIVCIVLAWEFEVNAGRGASPTTPLALAFAVLVGGAAIALLVAWIGSYLTRGAERQSEGWAVAVVVIAGLGSTLLAVRLSHSISVYFGVPFILGALAAGLAFGSLTNASAIVKRHLAPLADGIALPILCAYIGTRIDLIPHFDWAWVLIALVLFGDGKATGVVFVGRYVCRLDWRASMRMGTILAAGGAVPLIVALMVYEAGIIDQTLFVALVIANAVTAAFAAPVLRMIDAYFASSDRGGFSDD